MLRKWRLISCKNENNQHDIQHSSWFFRKQLWLVGRGSISWLISGYDFIGRTVANCLRDLWRVNKNSRSLNLNRSAGKSSADCFSVRPWLVFIGSLNQSNIRRCIWSKNNLNWVINICCCLVLIKMLKKWWNIIAFNCRWPPFIHQSLN